MDSTISILNDQTDKVKNALAQDIAAILEEVGIQAESNAVTEVDRAVYDTPERGYKRTGRLRNSISHEVSQGEKAVYVGTSVRYSIYVEMGSSRAKPRPFLKPAVTRKEYRDQYKQTALDILKGG